MNHYLGVDIGSLSCDAVLIGDDEKMLASSVFPTGANNRVAIERAIGEVLKITGLSKTDIKALVSTGYGRDRVPERLASVTEITCHARGIQALFPDTRVLIDIGGQDSKAIFFDDAGLVADFAMNDKCAAGTGRFLEAMARALQLDIGEMIDLDLGVEGKITLSSMCTVFAESEVVSLIADGVDVREIVHGLNSAIASRTVSLVKRIVPNPDGMTIAMSGGVARNNGVVRALEAALGVSIAVPVEPDTVGAFGAALFARQRST